MDLASLVAGHDGALGLAAWFVLDSCALLDWCVCAREVDIVVVVCVCVLLVVLATR